MTERKPESIHAGHRQRMLEAYLRTGLEGFSDVEAVELLDIWIFFDEVH